MLSQNNRMLGHRIPGVPVVVTIDPLALLQCGECLSIEAGGLNLGQVLVLLVLVQQEVHSVVPEQQYVGT